MDHLEIKAIQGDRFPLLRQVTEGVHDEATHCVDLFIAEVSIEVVVELFDGGQTMDAVYALADATDLLQLLFPGIIFVFDFADDQTMLCGECMKDTKACVLAAF